MRGGLVGGWEVKGLRGGRSVDVADTGAVLEAEGGSSEGPAGRTHL